MKFVIRLYTCSIFNFEIRKFSVLKKNNGLERLKMLEIQKRWREIRYFDINKIPSDFVEHFT